MSSRARPSTGQMRPLGLRHGGQLAVAEAQRRDHGPGAVEPLLDGVDDLAEQPLVVERVVDRLAIDGDFHARLLSLAAAAEVVVEVVERPRAPVEGVQRAFHGGVLALEAGLLVRELAW